jgi:hypothetical protein
MMGNLGNQREHQSRTIERRVRYFDSKGVDIQCASAGSICAKLRKQRGSANVSIVAAQAAGGNPEFPAHRAVQLRVKPCHER